MTGSAPETAWWVSLAVPMAALVSLAIAPFTGKPAVPVSPSVQPLSVSILRASRVRPPGTLQAALVHGLERAASRLRARRLAGPYARQALRDSVRDHLPPLLVAAVIHQENRGFIHHCAERVSPAGAVGPMQLMPKTAWGFLRVNPWNPRQNIRGGARYLAYLESRFHNLEKALIAYNAGPGAVFSGAYPESSVAYAQAILRNTGLPV